MSFQIIILAAGKGTRMGSDEPKALTLLHGKPFLLHILDTIRSLDESISPVIVVGHKKDRIYDVIGNDRIYAIQEEQLGTGHAVLSAKDSLKNNSDIVFVLSTDQPLVSKETIKAIIDTHMAKTPKITIGTVVMPDFEGWRKALINFGRIIRDQNGNILKNIEYKDATEDQRRISEVNPALYAFDGRWLWENIHRLRNENAQREYYLTDLIRLATEKGEQVEAVPLKNIMEGLQPNSREELQLLEDILQK